MAKTQKKPAEQTGRILPDLPFDQGTPEPKEPAQKASDMEAVLAEMRAQVAKLSGDLETANKERMALMTQAPIVQPQMRSTEVNMKDLPDPIQEPEKYAAEVHKRSREALQNEQLNAQAIAQTQNDAQGKLATLWEDFKETNPLYADEGKVRYIAQEVAAKAQARGRDVQKYMFTTPDTFFGDVKKLYDKTFGAPKAEGAEDDDEGSVLDEDDNRTAGIPGGGPSGGKKVSEEDLAGPGKSMFDGVKSWQLKNGFTI